MISNRALKPRRVPPTRGLGGGAAHLVVLGAGGNIGSHLIPLLARLSGVAWLTLVDFDRYEESNLQSQAITPADVGRPKARVQASRARRINPKLKVTAIVERLENVPPGCLRGDIILACLDSKESRRCASEIAWHLGVPWIDAGVEPSQLLARVNIYLPAANQPCLECAWSERDYADLGTIHPCAGGISENPATDSPACLGALAASLQAIECQKLLKGDLARALIGRQVLIDAATQRQFVTAFRRNPKCRFDHSIWSIMTLRQPPQELSVAAMLNFGPQAKGVTSLAFGGQPLVKRLHCPGCVFARRVFRLQHRLKPEDRFCDRCGRELLSAGFYMKARLSQADLGPHDADRSLASLGLRAGDVISLRHGAREKYFQLCAGPAPGSRPAKSIPRRSS